MAPEPPADPSSNLDFELARFCNLVIDDEGRLVGTASGSVAVLD